MTAVLVECRRVDGKPRQRTVGYFAGIRERFVGEHEREHRRFWAKVDERLDELELDPDTRAMIEASVESRVRRVTPENKAEFDAVRARLGRELEAEMAGRQRGG